MTEPDQPHREDEAHSPDSSGSRSLPIAASGVVRRTFGIPTSAPAPPADAKDEEVAAVPPPRPPET